MERSRVRRARRLLAVVGMALVLGPGWSSEVGAVEVQQEDPGDDLSGSWSIVETLVSNETSGPGGDGLYLNGEGPPERNETSYGFACDAGTCLSAFPIVGEADTVFTSTGDGTWEFSGPFQPSSPCQTENLVTIRLTRDGDELRGTQVRRWGATSLIVDQDGSCVSPETAFLQVLTYDVTGTLLDSGPTATTEGAAGATGPSSGPSSAADLTEHQEESLAAVERGDRSSVPASLATPADALDGELGENLLLAGLLVLLLVFPSHLFNSTWEEHDERIMAALGRRRATAAEDEDAAPRSHPARFALVAVAGAVIGGFLDPDFGADRTSFALVVGTAVSFLLAVAFGGLAAMAYRRARGFSTEAVVRAIPAGLLIAAVCVVVSRLVDFLPGYLYGLVGGLVFGAALRERDEGRAELAVLGGGLALALVAWLVSVPVSDAANGGDPSFAVQVLDALTAALFIGGIEGLLFGLAPIRFLPGRRIADWSWGAWTVAAAVVAFLFVSVLLRPANGYLGTSSTASVTVTYALFAGFGLASVAFWAWFRFRPDPEALASVPTVGSQDRAREP